ncbi:MAG: cation transporting ATPase C-terminal domain-containing protein, partial [Clostridia bacterium]|nr:cation transporting ATPase C-terminal domain-containing protein [Clostridia bacterium]
AGGLGFDVAFQGAVVTVLTLASYFIGHFVESGVWEAVDSPHGMTMAFLTLSMIEIFHSFNMRSRRGSVFAMQSHNKYLWGAMILSFVCTTAVIYVPFLSDAFGFEHISFMEYAISMGIAVLIIPIMETVKWIQRRLHK